MRYLDLDELLEIVRAVTGSDHAVRDWGLLSSAVERPHTHVFGIEAYLTLHAKAAALMQSVARNHALVDGNERVAWVAARAMLRDNGVSMRVDADEAVPFVEAVARGELDVDEIAKQFERWSG